MQLELKTKLISELASTEAMPYLKTKRQKLRSSGSGSYSIYTILQGVFRLWFNSCTVYVSVL